MGKFGRVPHLNPFYWLVVDRHKLTVFYVKSFDMDPLDMDMCSAPTGDTIYTYMYMCQNNVGTFCVGANQLIDSVAD